MFLGTVGPDLFFTIQTPLSGGTYMFTVVVYLQRSIMPKLGKPFRLRFAFGKGSYFGRLPLDTLYMVLYRSI